MQDIVYTEVFIRRNSRLNLGARVVASSANVAVVDTQQMLS
jgi:hypothetical protein